MCILHLVLSSIFVSSIQGHQSLFLHSVLLVSLSLFCFFIVVFFFAFLSPIHSWASTERGKKAKTPLFCPSRLSLSKRGAPYILMLLLTVYIYIIIKKRKKIYNLKERLKSTLVKLLFFLYNFSDTYLYVYMDFNIIMILSI